MPDTEDDILVLIEGCKRNDHKAQEQLYRRFYTAMATLCVRYINNREDAVQVLNDGFFKVFKNISTYDPSKSGLFNWMRTIMINTSIDFLKRKSLVYTNDTSIVDDVFVENTVIQKMDAEVLLRLIKKLPKATQLVFNLYTVEGYNHREIGEMLTISEGTSKWHVSEARKLLRQSILDLRKTND